MNQNGDTIVATLTTMVHSPISITERPLHTQLLRRMFNLIQKKLTNQIGDTTLEILTTMDHSPISTMAKLLLIPSSRRTSNWKINLLMSQIGDTTVVIHTTMDHSLISIMIRQAHTVLLRKIDQLIVRPTCRRASCPTRK